MVVSLVRDVLDRSMRVAIGNETGVEPLADCSLVVAPFAVDGISAARLASWARPAWIIRRRCPQWRS